MHEVGQDAEVVLGETAQDVPQEPDQRPPVLVFYGTDEHRGKVYKVILEMRFSFRLSFKSYFVKKSCC